MVSYLNKIFLDVRECLLLLTTFIIDWLQKYIGLINLIDGEPKQIILIENQTDDKSVLCLSYEVGNLVRNQ